MTLSDRTLLAAAIFSVALVASTQTAISSVYLGMYSWRDTLLGDLGFLSFIVVLVCILALSNSSGMLLKLFLTAFLASNIYTFIRVRFNSDPRPFWFKVALVLALLAFFYCLLRYIRSDGWRAISKFIVVFSFIFALSPLAVALILPTAAPRPVFDFPAAAAKGSVIVLVLDETSPEYAAEFVNIFRDAGLYVKSREVAAAGRSTLNAIPSMLSSARHDDVTPCNSLTLCGSGNFDFSSLTSKRDDVDIVGFWHPYCAIRGLRSCFREESVFGASSIANFGLYKLWCGQFNKFGLFTFCEKGAAHPFEIDRARQVLIREMDKAPFWQAGGLLYVHYPLPHPSMTADYPSLKFEYDRNFVEAKQLVARTTAQMKSRFGSDFLMIVTSDHPLRTAMWCATPQYKRAGCAAGLPPDRGRVLLTLASPRPIAMALPTSNVGLLSP